MPPIEHLTFDLSSLSVKDAENLRLHSRNPLVAFNNQEGTVIPGLGRNVTECISVPSSEHVAEIVGRQGKMGLGHILF